MRGYAKRMRSDKKPNASATESSPVRVTVNAVNVEATGTTEASEMTEVTAEREAEAVDVSMTGEEDIATRGRLLRRGFATTDTEPLLQRVELTAMFQAAHTETTLPPAGAARPRTIAPAAALPLLLGADAATHPASHALPPRLARPADIATTGPHPEMPATARTTTPRAKAKASAVTNTADPVRVLLLTSVAHDHPDDPTKPAAEGRPPTTADPLLRRNEAARHRRPSPDRHLAGAAAMFQAHGLLRVHRRGVAKGEMTKTGKTRAGTAKVMRVGAGAAVEVAIALATSHPLRSPNPWTRISRASIRTINVRRLEWSSHLVLTEDDVKLPSRLSFLQNPPTESEWTCVLDYISIVGEITIT